MIKPMLAEKLDKAMVHDWHDWVAEEKYDGHRRIIHVDAAAGTVKAYSRPRKARDGQMLESPLPPHVVAAFLYLTVHGFGFDRAIFDGEELAGDTATDVRRLDLVNERRFVVFDLLQLGSQSLMSEPNHDRRGILEVGFAKAKKLDPKALQLAVRWPLTSQQDVLRLARTIWKAGGEGLILKHTMSLYHAGQRRADWVKIKKLEHFTLTVVGFEATRGTVMKRGPFAIVRLRDEDGNETTCKTKDDFELERIEHEFDKMYPLKSGRKLTMQERVDEQSTLWGFRWPFESRKLVIECGGRTRDGGYKGPVIWDRWEDE